MLSGFATAFLDNHSLKKLSQSVHFCASFYVLFHKGFRHQTCVTKVCHPGQHLNISFISFSGTSWWQEKGKTGTSVKQKEEGEATQGTSGSGNLQGTKLTKYLI
jgi:hypothetical protein